jgi:hypothetical protein
MHCVAELEQVIERLVKNSKEKPFVMPSLYNSKRRIKKGSKRTLTKKLAAAH